jgi:hypothetical protein
MRIEVVRSLKFVKAVTLLRNTAQGVCKERACDVHARASAAHDSPLETVLMLFKAVEVLA